LKFYFFVLLLAVSWVVPAGAAPLQPENVRVAIVSGADGVKVDGDGLLAADDRGMPLRLTFPVQIKKSRDALLVGGKSIRSLRLAGPGVIRVNGKGYRGLIEVFPADKGVLVVDELPLEDYLVGLINCEISSLWPMEAVKAQAVIARTYALYQKESRKYALYHLESSVLDQVYEGVDIEDNRASRAVKETAGEVLTYAGKVIQAFYHSNCGGHTEAAVNVWGGDIAYLQGVDCKYCQAAPAGRWEQRLPLKKVESLLKGAGYPVSGLCEIRPGRTNSSGRLREVALVTTKGGQSIPAVNFRKALGYSVIKSTNFTSQTLKDELLFEGAGNGHGVGLCQWGAKQRATEGFAYQEILQYYYPGVRMQKVY
jgi:stage II sporulation protein D